MPRCWHWRKAWPGAISTECPAFHLHPISGVQSSKSRPYRQDGHSAGSTGAPIPIPSDTGSHQAGSAIRGAALIEHSRLSCAWPPVRPRRTGKPLASTTTWILRQVAPWGPGSQDPEDAIEDTAVIHPWNTTRLIRQERLDGRPLKIGEFVAHDSRLQFGNLNHAPGAIINPPRHHDRHQ